MTTITLCDDCGKEFKIQYKVQIWFYYPNLNEFMMCYTCFEKHWKPLQKKFSLKKKSSNQYLIFKELLSSQAYNYNLYTQIIQYYIELPEQEMNKRRENVYKNWQLNFNATTNYEDFVKKVNSILAL